MAIIDVRILRSLKISETKDARGSVAISASQELLFLADQKDPAFNEILEDATTWPNLGNERVPQLSDVTIVKGITLYVTGRELSYYKDNERAVVMTVRYSTKEASDSQPPTGEDPATWQRISITTQQMTKPAFGWPTQNTANNADQDFARNSAGDPVDGLEEDVAMVKLTYTNTQVAFPQFNQLNAFTNRCNSDFFLGAPVYSVRCVGWSGEYDQANNTWSISIEFLYKPDGWQIEFYDVGFNEIVDQARVAILDIAGNPVSKPVPLDGNGRAATIAAGGGTGGQYQPVPLTTRYLYPYQAVPMAGIWQACGV